MHLTVRELGALSPANLVASRAGEPAPAAAYAKLATAFRDTKAACHDALPFVCFERGCGRERRL